MHFRQLIHREGEAIAYLLACPRTRRAVLVDPVAGAESRYWKLLAELDLQLVYVLETTSSHASADRADRPYANLLAELGLDDAPPSAAAAPADQRFGVPRIGPVTRWKDEAEGPDADRVQVVQADGHILELSVCALHPPGSDSCLLGSLARSFRLRYDRIGIRVGDLLIEAWATGFSENALAYVLHDRVITGTSLTGVVGDPSGGAPHAVLSLAPDTLLFPTRTPNDVLVSTVHQEKLLRNRAPLEVPWMRASQGAHQPWQPVVHAGGGAVSEMDGELECNECDDDMLDSLGMPNPEGFREVHPGDLFAVLDHFRVLDFRDPAEFEGPLGRIRGAEPTSLRQLQVRASGWDPNERLVLVSEYGFRCRAAAPVLVKMGFKRIFRIFGGMMWWTESGLPVERSTRHNGLGI